MNVQGFSQPSQMLYNVILPTKMDFPLRSRCIFYFMFSLTFKVFVTFVTLLPFQSNSYIVLLRQKGPKNSVCRYLFKTKSPKQKSRRLPAVIYAPYGVWIGLQSFFYQDSLHARLNSYKKKKHKKIKAYRQSLQKDPPVNKCLLIPDLKPFRLQVKEKHSTGREFQGQKQTKRAADRHPCNI